MRCPRPPLFLLLLLLAAATPVQAQQARTSFLLGYGGADFEASLGLGIHLNVRHRIARRDSVDVSGTAPRPIIVPRVSLEAEAFSQLGRSGVAIGACDARAEQLCSREANPLLTVGGGLGGRVDMTSIERPVYLYFLPITAGLYLRRHELRERPLGSTELVTHPQTSVMGGIGNGMGVQARMGGVEAMLEVRAILMRDLRGERGGSLPVSLGVTW